MTYPEALAYLESLTNFERFAGYDQSHAFGLGRIGRLSGLLGQAHLATRAVHIAGSKGKGSTAAFVSSILRAAGMRVGLYTSPHLVTFRERISIDGEPIGEDDLARLAARIAEAAAAMADDPPTYFEAVTAAAYLYFKEQNVDIAVYEVGMGGRLDATNIVTPLAAAITPVSYEHTAILGPTLARIAFEKAGIVKEGVPLVTAPQEREAFEEIRKICRERHAPHVAVGHDIRYREVSTTDDRQVFDVMTAAHNYRALETRLLGAHQVVNAATAIGVVEELAKNGVIVPACAVAKGIGAARWPGRLEVAARRPYIVLDGAQNRASARALAEAIRKIFRYMRLILVLGVSKDKDVAGIVEELSPLADAVILTKADMPERALEPSALASHICAPKDITLTATVGEAVVKARDAAGPEDLVLVAGSLFVVGEAKVVLENDN